MTTQLNDTITMKRELAEAILELLTPFGYLAQWGYNSPEALNMRRLRYAISGECFQCRNARYIEYVEPDGVDNANVVQEPCPVCGDRGQGK